MEWRLAESLKKLREQVNTLRPGRSKDSDGSIGDASHATRSSDHNPWVKDHSGQPVVTAIDITHDPVGGFDSYAFADMLMANKDPRIKYVISNRRIGSGKDGPQPWVWRKYTGTNPHNHHVHISVSDQEGRYDSTAEWKIDLSPVDANVAADYTKPAKTLSKGATGPEVVQLRKLLHIPDGNQFDDLTYYVVKTWQRANNLVADGVVGPQTWKSLGASA
jgi:hypothetical protein